MCGLLYLSEALSPLGHYRGEICRAKRLRLSRSTGRTQVAGGQSRSGGLLWDVQYAEKKKHYGSTGAPLVVKDKVIVGTSGGDSGVRGFVAAFDAVTGKKKWQRWTIPAPGEFGSSSWPGDAYLHGGGSTWMTGTYDSELNTLYWTTSNAAPAPAARPEVMNNTGMMGTFHAGRARAR